MTYEILVAILAFAGSLIVLVTPIIKLNNNITRLNALLENTVEDLKQVQQETNSQSLILQNQENRIQKNEILLDEHEKRITKLEK